MLIGKNIHLCVSECNTDNSDGTISAFIVLMQCVCFQSILAGDELNKLSVDEGASLADRVALTIGQ